MSIRSVWVVVHRYTGLAMAGFLIIVGLTGSLLAFYNELELWLNPQVFAEAHGRQSLDPVSLIEQAEKIAPRARVEAIWLNDGAAHVGISPRVNSLSDQPYELDFDQIILDPYSGQELERRLWGDIAQGRVNLMTFIYKLHYALALDDTGMLVLGVVALIWTLDCFVGFYLTLPIARKKQKAHARKGYSASGNCFAEPNASSLGTDRTAKSKPSFWQRWRPAWKIKWRGSANRINFDLHRAGGLWLWPMLFVFAWSSVYMDLWDSVYTKVTQAVFDFHEPWTDLNKRDKPLDQPNIGWRDAYRMGNEMMAEAARQHNFEVIKPTGFRIDRELGVYALIVRSSLDIQDRGGSTQVLFDADSGTLKMLQLPKGQYDGNTVTNWLAALHMGNVFGMPYRVFVCVLGLTIVILSVTGVVIWLKKRQALRFHKRRQATPNAEKVKIPS